MIIPPFEPRESKPIRPPMVYVREPLKWEYKQVIRDLENEKAPDEEELNKLGAEGWELTSIVQYLHTVYFYFKRLADR